MSAVQERSAPNGFVFSADGVCLWDFLNSTKSASSIKWQWSTSRRGITHWIVLLLSNQEHVQSELAQDPPRLQASQLACLCFWYYLTRVPERAFNWSAHGEYSVLVTAMLVAILFSNIVTFGVICTSRTYCLPKRMCFILQWETMISSTQTAIRIAHAQGSWPKTFYQLAWRRSMVWGRKSPINYTGLYIHTLWIFTK